MAAEAFEARLMGQPFLDSMDELLEWRFAGVAELEATVLSALPAAHVHPYWARDRCGVQPVVPAARFFTPWAAARKASLVPAARTPIGTACAIP